MNDLAAPPLPALLSVERWAQVSPLLDELLDLERHARDVRLAELRHGDPELADELVALLTQQSQIERKNFLAGSALGALDAPLAGQTMGAYTLERPLGAGGMGSVWLARRSDGRYERQVAVKLLNLALLARGGEERFAREGSLLARLTHPNIARLLDAGVTANGQPYLVLEHIAGESIDRWCESRALGIEARVRLVLDVLAAVAHAHSKLVLHRDLKPANILVTADGRVKLLDFGIAKLLDDEAQPVAATALTQLGGRAFTPDYAAPEQVEGGDATTATDVYALGVLLYMLLGGGHPTSKPTQAPVERLRSIVETEPLRLSEAVARGAGSIEARDRHVRTLRGDLDNIVGKALKKAPAERYSTAAAFADDLRRYLADEPISARSDSFGYRAAKFIRRHRLAVGAAAITMLALMMGIVGTTWQAIEAQRQREHALAQRDRAQALLDRNEAIIDFVDMMFSEAVPAGQSAAIEQMLERSERLINSTFAGRPDHQGEVLRVLATYYGTLNLPNKHVELMARAREIVAGIPDRSLKARLACFHANALSAVGKADDAKRILEAWINAPELEAAVAASCLQVRAEIAQTESDPQATLRYAEAGLQRLREAGATVPLLEANLLADVGFGQRLAGRNAEADRTFQAALERMRQLGRGESHEAGWIMIGHGLVRYAMADFKGGLELFEHVLRIYETRGVAVVSPSILGNRAYGLEQLGRLEEAQAAYERTLDAARRSGLISGEAFALVGRAAVQAELGHMRAARASLDDAAVPLRTLPPAHAARIRGTMVQARIDAAHGDLSAATAGYTRVIDLLSRQGALTPPLSMAHRHRADLALLRGDTATALADARKALDLARTLQGSSRHSALSGLAHLTLGRVRSAMGDAGGSHEAWSVARAELLHTLGQDHPDTRAARRLLDGD